jgi:hypothetical protein
MPDFLFDAVMFALFAQGAVVSQMVVFLGVQRPEMGTLAYGVLGGIFCFFFLALVVRDAVRTISHYS